MIDTHAHLNYPPLDSDLDGVLARAREAGVERIIIPGTDVLSSLLAQKISQQYTGVYFGVGVHPEHAHEYKEGDKELLQRIIDEGGKVTSVGEVGLDYYHLPQDITSGEREQRQAKQKTVFADMLALAAANKLPLSVHSREAFVDTSNTIESSGLARQTLIHCFTGDIAQANSWLDLGCQISVTAIITYKKNQPLRDVIKEIPLDRLMLETDAPFLPPEGHRGQVCEPVFIREVAICLAEIKGVSLHLIERLTSENAERFFKI